VAATCWLRPGRLDVVAARLVITFDDNDTMSETTLLPVIGLNIARPWQVGRVLFHPAGAAVGLIEAARAGSENDALQPEEQSQFLQASTRLNRCVVAEVSVSRTGSVAVAEQLVESALAVLRLVQRMANKSWLVAFQGFGLPGRVNTASYDFINLTGGRMKPVGVPEVGFRAVGAIQGGATLGDGLHRAWANDQVYRFIHEALARAEAGRTPLQARALLAIELLSQAWLSDQPDVRLLPAAMALEVLLAESSDQEKKARLARRVSYLACGAPNIGDCCPGDRRAACPFLTLPLRARGKPGPELERLIRHARAGTVPGCRRFLDVLEIYEGRNTIVHEGRLRSTIFEPRPDTRFIEQAVLKPTLTWFSEHLEAELTELDTEIAQVSST
jgi:hypothetical protein